MIRARVIALVTAILSTAASSATAGTTVISFSHNPTMTIVEYRALVGFKSGNYTLEYSLGLPALTSSAFSTTLAIPDDVKVFLAVVAIDEAGNRSAPSNERVRFTSSNLLGAPGQPQLLNE